MQVVVNAVTPTTNEMLNSMYHAWTLLANVSEGDWSRQQPDWVAGVEAWRDNFHSLLHEYGLDGPNG